MYCNRLPLAANHVPLVAHIILLERVICFPCLSEYRHQPIPALHIPCTACNITFISMICHFSVVLACFFTIPAELLMVRLASGIEHGWVYANVEGVTISHPDCYVTVGVMF